MTRRLSAWDISIAVLLFSVVAWWTIGPAMDLERSIYNRYGEDSWFQSDTRRTLANMTDRHSDHFRTQVHPLASLVLHPYVTAVGAVSGGTPTDSALMATGLLAGLWALAMFALLRLMNLERFDAVVFTLLGVSSAAFMFWFRVPETYGAGSLTIIAVLIGAVWADRRGGISDRSLIGLNVFSLSMTVTNWMAGVALAFRARSVRQAVRIVLIGLAVTLALALVQKAFYPTSNIFLLGAGGEGRYMNRTEAGTAVEKLRSLVWSVFAAPRPLDIPRDPPFQNMLGMQHAVPGSATAYGPGLIALWSLLLVMGTVGAALSARRNRTLVSVLALTLLGQIGLHLVYGEETFLYSLHLLPLWIVLAALSHGAPGRRVWTAIALVCAGAAFAHNNVAWDQSAGKLRAEVNVRDQVLREKQAHPERPWPRGIGHVVLGMPGSALDAKAYHEPGASFSPAPGSFGVSLWVVGTEGNLISSSETLPLESVEQKFVGTVGTFVPSIDTETPYFRAVWTHDSDATTLALTAKPLASGQSLWLVVRSAGPAGGAIDSVVADGPGVAIGSRWRLSFNGAIQGWAAGDEQNHGVDLRSAAGSARANSPGGWGYAAARLEARGSYVVRIDPVGAATSAAQAAGWPVYPLWNPNVSDPLFVSAARAQQAHLLMGLTDRQTRPGEPLSYDHERVREAAFIVAALARAGQAEIARALSLRSAEKDFFGSYDSDSMGLSLWALGEVSRSSSDPAFDRSVLPHVRRKLLMIEHCLHGSDALILDGNRICELPRMGLVVGAAYAYYPILHVNAMTFAGLNAAAEIARRAGDVQTERMALQLAGPLPDRWAALFRASQGDRLRGLLGMYATGIRSGGADFRAQHSALGRESQIARNWIRASSVPLTYASPIWPSWIAARTADARASLVERLDQRWNESQAGGAHGVDRSPRYVNFAEAHQSLLTGRPERALSTLQEFYSHDASPGLFASWEGSREENTSDQWAALRGWLQPVGVSPDYWSAAEALLLQMDMLIYVDESASGRSVVIGAGVPAGWLKADMDSGTIATEYGPLRWTLDSGRATLRYTGATEPPYRLGPALQGIPVTAIRSPPAAMLP